MVSRLERWIALYLWSCMVLLGLSLLAIYTGIGESVLTWCGLRMNSFWLLFLESSDFSLGNVPLGLMVSGSAIALLAVPLAAIMEFAIRRRNPRKVGE